jgi:hypothetical protein
MKKSNVCGTLESHIKAQEVKHFFAFGQFIAKLFSLILRSPRLIIQIILLHKTEDYIYVIHKIQDQT